MFTPAVNTSFREIDTILTYMMNDGRTWGIKDNNIRNEIRTLTDSRVLAGSVETPEAA